MPTNRIAAFVIVEALLLLLCLVTLAGNDGLMKLLALLPFAVCVAYSYAFKKALDCADLQHQLTLQRGNRKCRK